MNKITDPEVLHDELLKLGLKETTMEEFSKWKQYSLEGDRDPRWQLKYRIYNKKDDFVVIFEKDGVIYSSRGFGRLCPKQLDKLLGYNVEYSMPETDEEY